MAPKGISTASQNSWSSSEEPPTSVLHESAEEFNVDVQEKKIDRQAAMDSVEFNDMFSALVRKGSSGVALYFVLAISVVISFVSFMLIFQYNPPLQQEGESDWNLWGDVCTPQQHKTVWADLLTEQIEILQNLIHASLLGGATLVAAYRGDVVWLFFVRNLLVLLLPGCDLVSDDGYNIKRLFVAMDYCCSIVLAWDYWFRQA